MIRKAILVAAALALCGAVYAQESAKRPAKITGFVVDVMCDTGKDVDAKRHKVSCALMPDCEKTGFAVVSKDTSYKLDAEGNRRVLEMLKATKIKQGFAVTVEGTLVGDVLHADSVIEAN
ncbi:MAG TPA: hypothetical protein VER32_03150 [Pyrinomonadaceae bacterium]|nr:hypothetical protein [Pyrinomonadaceae bacterium]